MCVTYENNYIIYEMAKLSSEKRKNTSFPKKKSLVGLTPDYDFTAKLKNCIHNIKTLIIFYAESWEILSLCLRKESKKRKKDHTASWRVILYHQFFALKNAFSFFLTFAHYQERYFIPTFFALPTENENIFLKILIFFSD